MPWWVPPRKVADQEGHLQGHLLDAEAALADGPWASAGLSPSPVVPGKGEEMIWVLPYEQQKLLELFACYFKGSFCFHLAPVCLLWQTISRYPAWDQGHRWRDHPSQPPPLPGRAVGASPTHLPAAGWHQSSSAWLGDHMSLQNTRPSHLHGLLQRSLLRTHSCPQARDLP